MSIEAKITSNFRGLDKIIAQLGDKGAGVKVGILGSTDTRKEDGSVTNAEIGIIQEYGSVSRKIPPRSFLRMPILAKKNQLINQATTGDTRKKLLSGDIKGALTNIGYIAEEIIDDAFKSSGFGAWPANSPITTAKKGSSKPLIDTGQLRRAITSKVVNG